MHAASKAIILLVLTAAASTASTLLQGAFASDDQVELFYFTLNSAGPVMIESYGYGGSIVNSINPGGFAAYAALFVLQSGFYVESAFSDGSGDCPPGNLNPLTGSCADPIIQATLPAGDYYLALSVQDNVPVDGFLADGYTQTGNPGFTCAEGGLTGQFCDVTDPLYRTRTPDWALSFAGVSSVQDVSVPEPPTWWLMPWGVLAGALTLRPKASGRYCS
ncbi:MAG: DVUA0089 family protein [Bryobacteraceae bacterium]